MPRDVSNAVQTAPNQRFHTFRVSKSTSSSGARKRAKFDPKRREEVKAVRHKRSCLRCALLKIKCSDDDLCTTCEQLVFVNQSHERKTLSFSGCIRTRLKEVSVFEVCFSSPQDGCNLDDTALDPTLAAISLEFGAHVTWDLEALVGDIVEWLSNPTESQTSKVGTLSSPQFLNLVRNSVEDKGASQFQRMMYATSRAYTRYNGPLLTAQELSKHGSVAGHHFLTYLDEKLKPTYLAKSTVNQLQILFLWVFGTILAVGYAGLECATSEVRQTFSLMQNHLCQILAHYLIYIGSHLGLSLKSSMDRFILETALMRWHGEGRYEWKPSVTHEVCDFSAESLQRECHDVATRPLPACSAIVSKIREFRHFDSCPRCTTHWPKSHTDTEEQFPANSERDALFDLDDWLQFDNPDINWSSTDTSSLEPSDLPSGSDTSWYENPWPDGDSQLYQAPICSPGERPLHVQDESGQLEQKSEYRPPECDNMLRPACLYVSGRKKPRSPRPKASVGCMRCKISLSHAGNSRACKKCVRWNEQPRAVVEDQYLLI
ncbi:hypothetical protein ONS95_002055 [Cadophora gregata]|uniref:uncharacterized protein n=1 Tax=Cadophora gregata TaxID=51156 RepID=UPI0026DAC186|nr:uncharacterized protein ONS95_002055 [Cadophora gregata]KAK0111712.1 hypothetical protein ONS95_002055 [Cadophora gregata]KAK0111812.1 hypothetical protein ONS96_001080 [Cadophora gregata f. sp. sojae]